MYHQSPHCAEVHEIDVSEELPNELKKSLQPVNRLYLTEVNQAKLAKRSEPVKYMEKLPSKPLYGISRGRPADMEIGSGSRQSRRKCRPMWDLRRQKNCRRKIFYVCGLYFHNLHHC